MSFSKRALRAIEENWRVRRFSKKSWILGTTNFVFILHDNIKNWMKIGWEVPLYLPQNMILLYYNRITKKFRLYVKNIITIKMLNVLCEVFKCPTPSYTTHEIYIDSFENPDHTKFEKSPEGDIYFQKLKCGENCVIYNGEYYLIEMGALKQFSSYNFGMLDLSRIGVQDISEIRGLDTLQVLGELDLSHNKIAEIKCLENLKNLYSLNFNNNRITEIKSLENLKNLYKLNLNNNEITEIKGIESLKRLRFLYLKNNQIKEIKGLENFSIDRDGGNMELNLGDNPIPLMLLRKLGGLNKFGFARDPEIIVDYCIKKKAEIEKFDRSFIVKLKKIVKISNRFRIDMLMDILDIDKKTLIKNIEKWSADFSLEINGNYLIIKKDMAQELMDALDKQFYDWERT